MIDEAFEVNFDGLVGPTHNYGGLSFGNVASIKNQESPSNPQEAALQGLHKMKLMHDLGLKQALLPPQERPFMPVLRDLGFTGNVTDVLNKAAKEAPEILINCGSAACMWTANAATIAPSADTADGRVHFTPANLSSKFHRSIEHYATAAALRNIFESDKYFLHHPILPAGQHFSDEGAANHTRFCRTHGGQGVHLFIFGRYHFRSNMPGPQKFPARQTYEASNAVARRHTIPPRQVVLFQQNPDVIDAGVFHNDVISVGNGPVFLYHEKAFLGTEELIEILQDKLQTICETDLIGIKVPNSKVSVEAAVTTYLFNSPIVTLPDNTMRIICPIECQENEHVSSFLNEMVQDTHNPIKEVHFMDLRHSMRNGGGPACLRLRVVLTGEEIKAANPHVFFSDELYKTLQTWVKKHYRDRVLPNDLQDPKLYEESCAALQELTEILHLGPLYSFQQN